MTVVDEAFLLRLASQLDGADTLGVTMEGSLARGEGGRYSDVDLTRYVTHAPENKADAASLRFVEGILVSVKTQAIAEELATLRQPQKAIWAIPELRQARLLLDKDGVVAGLIEAARRADWRELQPAADEYASHELCSLAEEVHKVLDGLALGKPSKVIYATWGLSEGLARILLVQRGVLVPTENVFIDLAQSTAGQDSAWSRLFRRVVGLDAPAEGEEPYRGVGIAALRLYRETASLIRDILQAGDREVIDRTLDVVAEAGW